MTSDRRVLVSVVAQAERVWFNRAFCHPNDVFFKEKAASIRDILVAEVNLTLAKHPEAWLQLAGAPFQQSNQVGICFMVTNRIPAHYSRLAQSFAPGDSGNMQWSNRDTFLWSRSVGDASTDAEGLTILKYLLGGEALLQLRVGRKTILHPVGIGDIWSVLHGK